VRAFVLAMAAHLALAIPAARAQDPAAVSEPASLLVGVEARRDSLRYHFENPSSIDTPFLVPHFFEQTYDASNVWLVVTARYSAGVRWETSAGLTPQRTVRADDFDTFVDPGNVVLVSGTTGDALARGVLFSQAADVARAGKVQVSLRYRFRWDRFNFLEGHKTVTRDGLLITSSEVTSPEMTDSKVHEVLVGLRAASPIAGAWRLAVSGEISPATLARLSVQLPEKYPGQDLVFFAKVLAVSARVALVRAGERFPIEIALQAERTFSYRSTDQLTRSAQSIRLSAGRAW
jgi:hypothetical protein